MLNSKYKLGECCTIIAGQSPESKYYNLNGDGLPFFQGKTDFGDVYPQIRVYCSQPIKIAEKDDILLSVRAPVGPTNLAPCKVCIGRGLTAIRPKDFLLTKYLLLYLKSFELELASQGKGTTFKSITQNIIKSLEIWIPSIEKQKQIVKQIEESLSQLDSAVATLNKTKQQLEIYRQAVLKEAFDGINTFEILGNLAVLVDPHPSHRTPPTVENGVPYIGIGDINYDDMSIDFSNARKVSPELLNEHLERYKIKKGDFVMGKIGTIGKPFYVPMPQEYLLSANVILIQHLPDKVNPEFLFWQFSSNHVTRQLVEGANATSQPAFGIKKSRLIRIKTCSQEKQKQIVDMINEKMSVCDRIKQVINQSLQQAEALRQSILKQAFEVE